MEFLSFGVPVRQANAVGVSGMRVAVVGRGLCFCDVIGSAF